MTRFAAILFFCAAPLFCQSNSGELRLKVTDPEGLAVKTTVQIVSQANQYRNTLTTNEQGRLDVRRLPYGIYELEISQPGFALTTASIDIHSSFPVDYTIQLLLPTVKQSLEVSAANTLIDPDQPGAINHVGSDDIQNRLSSIPGRSLQDLVNSQPGWLYEGNAVLHPRGSEYQTQIVVDGIPLTDNRSPSFGPAIDADDIQSLSIYTGGIPAEYGRKMGGIVEVNTLQDSQPGFHGQLELSGGTFDSAAIAAQGQYVWGKNTLGASASGSMSSHYLNPVVPENFTNSGTLGDFSTNYERDLTPKDRLRFIVRHELARYEIPNELVQQDPQLIGTLGGQPSPPPGTPPQLQTAANFETMGSVTYQHTFSPNVLIDARGMVRDNSNDFYSNPYSWPIIVSQHNDFKEGYFNTSVSIHHGHHEWKAGLESDSIFLHENYSDIITANPNYPVSYPFDPGTVTTFAFTGHRPDLEQSAYVQDLIHFGNWTVNAGLRWDHYQLLLNQNAVSPRFAVARFFPKKNVMLHFSYDRIFQTPSFENILLSSSTEVQSFEPNVLRLPVQPSHGNYFEGGASKSFFGQFRFDANLFRRAVNNYADDDQIFNTSISFPIAFEKAILYGAEGKLELPHWKRFSGFLSESYIVGNAWYPVTGGLLLGVSKTCIIQPTGSTCLPLSGHFPDSQDQRHSVRGRLRYQLHPRVWIAGGIQYDTGLPFQIDTSPAQALAEYGPQVIARINFARGRIYPAFQVNASAGADVYKSDRITTRFQIDGQNLNNILNVIDFGGLFSGNAIGPSRSVSARLTTTF
ncbi:MAG: carboxypeptidase regulatory-like domain-containing protein [Terriglobales bacterium]